MKRLAIIMLGLLTTLSAYAEDNCDPAVDAADSMNVNQKTCDYTNEGLNGALHKAFKKGSEGAVLETSTQKPTPVAQSGASLSAKNTNKIDTDAAYFSLSVEVDQWASVALARTQLLPKAMERCVKGFSVQSEHYRPLAMGRIELSMYFGCLN